MKSQKLLGWFQIVFLALIAVLLLLGIQHGDQSWQLYGFGSFALYAVTIAAFVGFAVDFRSLALSTKISGFVFAFGIVVNALLGTYLENNPNTEGLQFLGFITLPIVPAAYFLWYYGVAKRLNETKRIALATAAFGFALWALTFIWPGNTPMKDTEMANVVVNAGLFLSAGVVSLVIFALTSLKRK
ncbi:MAG: hypothetical protein ACKOWE_02495 [Micrococcales bacterium]